MKAPVGRPSKYNEETQKLADQYVYDFESTGHAVPSRSGLCVWLGVVRSTLQEWEANFPEFSVTCKQVDVMQEFKLVNGGLTNQYNAQIVKLMLSNHGYSEKSQTDITSSDGSMKQPTRIELVAVSNDNKKD